MRWKLLLLSLIVVILSPLNQAETTILDEEGDFTFQWQLDLGEVYVSLNQSQQETRYMLDLHHLLYLKEFLQYTLFP